MDPDTTMQEAMQAARDGDAYAVIMSLCTLMEWMAKGGFAPQPLEQRLDALRVVVETNFGG